MALHSVFADALLRTDDKLTIRLSGNSEAAGRRKIQRLPGERKSNFVSFNEIRDEIAKRYDSCMIRTTRQD